jgi:predicted ATPase
MNQHISRLDTNTDDATEIEADRVALASKVLVITGGPGVGKTTLVNSILKILLREDHGHRAKCAHWSRRQAPLGKYRGEAKTTGCSKPTPDRSFPAH